MERIVYRKTLDVHKNGIQFTLQGFETADNMARKIEISLMASGDTIDLPLEQITAMMYVTTPNATEPSINKCLIKDNTIIYDVLPIVEEGITEMQLKLIETGLDGAKGVLAAPRFAVEVTQSNTDDESATQTPTFTALEDAVAKAKGVYDSRLIGIEISKDFTFRAKYADGTIYESDVLKELSLHGDVLLSQSYAKGGTGIRKDEDTDNSMYYSNVSKSASAEASRISAEATELLEEVTKHGVYTSFSVNFDTGEVEYISPSYTFNVNKNNGELEAHGEAYTPDETFEALFNDLHNDLTNYVDSKVESGTWTPLVFVEGDGWEELGVTGRYYRINNFIYLHLRFYTGELPHLGYYLKITPAISGLPFVTGDEYIGERFGVGTICGDSIDSATHLVLSQGLDVLEWNSEVLDPGQNKFITLQATYVID